MATRDSEPKDRAPGFGIFGPDLAPVCLDNAAANRKPDAHAAGFGRHEGLKKPGTNGFCQTGTAIGHADLDHIAGALGCDGELLPGRTVHRLEALRIRLIRTCWI